MRVGCRRFVAVREQLTRPLHQRCFQVLIIVG
jgi:hypothetical protein